MVHCLFRIPERGDEADLKHFDLPTVPRVGEEVVTPLRGTDTYLTLEVTKVTYKLEPPAFGFVVLLCRLVLESSTFGDLRSRRQEQRPADVDERYGGFLSG